MELLGLKLTDLSTAAKEGGQAVAYGTTNCWSCFWWIFTCRYQTIYSTLMVQSWTEVNEFNTARSSY
jgi:hypothetical protein